MISPEGLFGEAPAPAAVLAFSPFLTRAHGARDRGSDATSRIALGAYLVARLVDRRLTMSEDPDDLEGFQWQLASTRHFVSELPSDEAEVAHQAGLVEITGAGARSPDGVLRMALNAYAYFLEHEGRCEEAVEVLGLSGRTWHGVIPAAEGCRAALFLGRLNRMLGRWPEAARAYTLAQDAADLAGDIPSAMAARIGLGNVLRGQGDLLGARKALEQVVTETGAPGLRDIQGRAFSDLSAVLGLQGFLLEALLAKYAGLVRLEDGLQRARVLCELGVLLRELGAYGAARLAFDMVLRSDASFAVKSTATLELMELESALGNRVAFERHRQEARSVEGRMPPGLLIDCRYKTGIALVRFGQVARARAALRAALALAEQHGLHEWRARIAQVLHNLDTCRDAPDLGQDQDAVDAPAVNQVAAGVHELAVADGPAWA